MIAVEEVTSHHVRRGKKSRVVWSALAVNRRSRPYLYDLVTIGDKPANAGLSDDERYRALCACLDGVDRAHVVVILGTPAPTWGAPVEFGYVLGRGMVCDHRWPEQRAVCVGLRELSIFGAASGNEYDTDDEAVSALIASREGGDK